MIRRATIVTIALVCLACGDGGAGESGNGLRTPKIPDCFALTKRQQGLVTGGGGPAQGDGSLSIPGRAPALDQMTAAAKSLREFELSFALQAAQVISRAVHEDPEASSWTWSDVRENGALFVEGESLHRTELSGSLAMRLWSTGPLRRAVRADVSYTPLDSVYDFGDLRVEVSDTRLAIGEWQMGCAEPDVSYEQRAFTSELSCWRSDGVAIEAATCRALFEQATR